MLMNLIKSKTVPTEEDFDNCVLRSKDIYHILRKDFAVACYSNPKHDYYRVYRQGYGRPIGKVEKDAPIPFQGDYVEMGKEPDLLVESIAKIATGEEVISRRDIDVILRQKQTLEELLNDRLVVIVTHDNTPGKKRLYLTKQGAPVFPAGYVTTGANDVEAGLWVFALHNTNKPEYQIIDLCNECDYKALYNQ